ncbi:hypothetical protein [Flammeovirga pacifica]|uniref:DNA recombination protein RmuC n=1 Tax=Flammeovirga pacifica TaxID=915059 RepID=A0A1S1YVE6_FLAPC|nr:hypothetical protein [Flammeovirga pacifica]OHX64996.1 hypothetical protein NH26_00840 [Flammeovirga pacifica]
MFDTFDLQSLFFGLLAGLGVALFIQIKSWVKLGSQKKEIKRLKSHLHDKMEIDAEAINNKKGEIERLKRENENLRVTNKALMNKPGRQEMMTYHAFQLAIDKLNSNMMGFGPAWQDAFKDAKEEVKSIEEGDQSFMKKVLPKGLFGGNTYELDEGE